MQLDEGQLRAVPDGGTLYRLPSGIEIIRWMKHEPIETEGLRGEELERLTDKVSGSKFLGGMTLADIVRINAYVTDRAHMAGYMAARDRHAGTPPPASTLMIVTGFTRPEFVVEIEVIAARKERRLKTARTGG